MRGYISTHMTDTDVITALMILGVLIAGLAAWSLIQAARRRKDGKS
jgi:hypothetical protein